MKELVVLVFVLSFILVLLGTGLWAILTSLIPQFYDSPLGKMLSTAMSVSGGVCTLTLIPALIFLHQNDKPKSD